MRLDDDARKCVFFIGHAPDGDASFKAVGTGFFIKYDAVQYLVTAKHVAVGLADAPFHIRLNRSDGGSDTVHMDPMDEKVGPWRTHEDPTVDIAVMVFNWRLRPEYDTLAIDQSILANPDKLDTFDIGVGDVCYAVGLLKLRQGKKRNLPVVHRGSIAAMPDDEPIPTRAHKDAPVVSVTGYLVELQNMRGLSGSPVVVRPTVLGWLPRAGPETGIPEWPLKAPVAATSQGALLLGVWSSSWDAPMSEELAVAVGADGRVPIGLGIVCPTERLVEILLSPAALAEREKELREMQARVTSK